MNDSKEKTTPGASSAEVTNGDGQGAVKDDLDALMRKYDRESNTRIWTGKPKIMITAILAAFSIWCIYVTLFATFLEEIRLTSFLGLVILMGFLIYPSKKGIQKENYMPLGDIIFMIAGAASFC